MTIVHQTGRTAHGTPAHLARVALVAAGATILPVPAAEAACMPRAKMVELLDGNHSESLSGRGLHSNGLVLIEVFVSPDGGTWTVLRTSAAGISCIMASGAAWRSYSVKRGVPG